MTANLVMSRTLVGILCVISCGLLVSMPLRAYPRGAPPAMTGGFGEETCVNCHNTNPLNIGRDEKLGDLIVTGLPKEYEHGKTYPVKVELTHMQDGGAWGFELATRTKDGAQAGNLEPGSDGRTQVLTEKGIQYATHTADGIFSNVFELNWVAPPVPVGEVIVNVTGNTADGDASPVGDYIYASSVTLAASH